MANYINQNEHTIIQDDSGVIVDGVRYDIPKSSFFGQSIVQYNNHLYINGRELKDGKWKMTIRSIFNTLFA